MKLTTFFTVKKTKTEAKSKSDFRSTSKNKHQVTSESFPNLVYVASRFA